MPNRIPIVYDLDIMKIGQRVIRRFKSVLNLLVEPTRIVTCKIAET